MSFLPTTNPAVRVVVDKVPLGGVEFTFQDRSIGGLDDKVYEADRAVWGAVPRGDCVISAGGAPVGRVVGLRKFGYPGAPYGRRSDVKKVILIDKENGECAHVAAFVADGVRYWVAGSKHVHIAWRVGHYDTDIAAYGAERYKYARKVAAVWNRMLSSDGVDGDWFFTMLDGMRATACAEAILSDSEHIVEYADDAKDTLKFYALAEPGGADISLCAGPELSRALFERCGLPTANYSTVYAVDGAEYAAALDAVARRNNSEGVVAYGMDDLGHVVCMWKEKSYPYVMERVVREAVIGDRTLAQLKRRVRVRLDDQPVAVRAYFAEWETTRFPWLLCFAAWLRSKGVIPARDSWSVQSRWLTLQREFRAAPAAVVAAAEAAVAAASAAEQKVIVLVGLPGSGKSTLARGLQKLLTDAGGRARWLNQDEADSNRQRYLGAIKSVMADPSVTHIILDKSNLDAGNRKDYTDLGLDATLTVVLEHREGLEATKAVCAQRFLARGAAHRSLRAAGDGAVDRDKFLGICDSMLARWRGLDDALHLDILLPPAEMLATVCARLGCAVTAGDCDAAVSFSRQYEDTLGAIKRPMYGGLTVTGDTSPLRAAIPADALAGKHLRGAFHITLRYLGDVMDPVWFMNFVPLLGSSVEVRISEIVWDESCVAARVALPAGVTCANDVPHITLALARGTQPVYSNTLLASAGAAVSRIAVDIPLNAKYFFG
jgi:energy-coupling factor transporter ATP-binding protein EcfA2